MCPLKRVKSNRERRILREWSQGAVGCGKGEAKLERTRQEVANGWRGVSGRLKADGDTELGRSVDSFLAQMPSANTERSSILFSMLNKIDNSDTRIIPAPEPKDERFRGITR
jgi:hypothetical protein